MPKCVPCISSKLRVLMIRFDPKLESLLKAVADCPKGQDLNLCGKEKRVSSEYQRFISDCMKTKPIKGKPFGVASGYMKECAGAWRERRGLNVK